MRGLVSIGRMVNPLSTILPPGEDNAKALSDEKAEIELFMREHNAEVGGVSGSSHLTGWAADIRADSSNRRFLILRGLLAAGFNRVGIGQNFIHVDCDPSKAGNVSWLY